MSRLLLSFAMIALTLPLGAQSGRIIYNQSTRLDFNFPSGSPMAGMMGGPGGNRIPRSITRTMIMTYTADGALFVAAPQVEGSEAAAMTMRVREGMAGGSAGREMVVLGGAPGSPMTGAMAAGFAAFAGGGRGGSQDAVVGAFTDLTDGSYVEVREFLGRNFRIQSDPPSYPWRLTGEQAVFLGYPVFQAIATQDSTTLEAWFTPDIPVSAGPAQYGGLPGMILTLAVDSNRVTYSATAIDTISPVGKVSAPSDGSKVSRSEYDKIVEEKTAELMRSRRTTGRGN